LENQELEHFISILIELKLYPILKILEEGSIEENKIEQERQKEIIKFINDLPDEYKGMPNRDEIIAKVLERMGMHTMWGNKKLEEQLMKEKQRNLGKLKEKQNSHSKEEQGR